ncbi:translation initiation factor IF-2-like [Onychomys torridus]|uniref:translation initiation factor IF-2-like n=1 Tax=Onychomys torridus TaxID=38674 RepID=UPI00167F7692|nr:translation initiation factor IF-2-like [Onychomys torridus]
MPPARTPPRPADPADGPAGGSQGRGPAPPGPPRRGGQLGLPRKGMGRRGGARRHGDRAGGAQAGEDGQGSSSFSPGPLGRTPTLNPGPASRRCGGHVLRWRAPDPPLLCTLPPFWVLGAERSRKEPKQRRKEPKFSLVLEAFPKRWRKGTKVSGRGGVTQWNLRKEPKIRIGLNLLRGRERALETFGKSEGLDG